MKDVFCYARGPWLSRADVVRERLRVRITHTDNLPLSTISSSLTATQYSCISSRCKNEDEGRELGLTVELGDELDERTPCHFRPPYHPKEGDVFSKQVNCECPHYTL